MTTSLSGKEVHAVRTERIAIREGLALTADICGNDAAPAVVLIHGGAQSRRSWERSLVPIASAGFQAVSIDARGHGESDWAPDGRYAVEDWAIDVERLVERIGARERKVGVVGASRGGQAALVAAANRPDCISSVALIDVAPHVDETGIALVRGFMQRSAQGFRSLEEASAILSGFLSRPPRTDTSALERLMRRGDSGRWYWQWDPHMALPQFIRPPSEQPLLEDAAARLRMPILLIRAGLSELVRAQDVAAFLELTPQLEVKEIPGIGHMMTGDRNDAFLPPVLDFLRRTLHNRNHQTYGCEIRPRHMI